MIGELLFPSSILKLNRKSLVIVLETEIYIYDISNMRLLHVIETTPSPEGTYLFKPCVCNVLQFRHLAICAFSPAAESPKAHISPIRRLYHHLYQRFHLEVRQQTSRLLPPKVNRAMFSFSQRVP